MSYKNGLDIEILYQEFYSDIYRYVSFLNFNKNGVEDIIQNTFVRALKGHKNFKGNSSVKTWLFAIARNESIRYQQQHPANETVPLFENAEITIYVEDFVCNKETAQFIITCIDTYEEPKKSLLLLRLLQSKTFLEIGEIMGKSDTWCRVTFMRAKNEILKKLEEENHV